MSAYPDTSFLCALYRTQDNSDRALAYRAGMNGPLQVTKLLLWEFRQGVRFQAFRYRKGSGGFPMREAEKMIADVQEDIDLGLVQVLDCDFPSILVQAERLSKAHTFTNGHRSMDMLHIATALELQATDFLTFDGNQKKLAEAEGMTVPF
ncbi:MAG: type II toxin-antitoxin system VapC family toxin [Verrucomicrobiales bacterium]|nr:type II toxin-antitoxin system VapC family toxin [Verrucomicrobiales bacterium]